jgi:acetyl-CoA acetyltransferase
MALIAIASGELESALVIGAEKMTDSPGDEITASLATAADAELEADFGLSFVGLNALLMRRYMYEYSWEHKDFAIFQSTPTRMLSTIPMPASRNRSPSNRSGNTHDFGPH